MHESSLLNNTSKWISRTIARLVLPVCMASLPAAGAPASAGGSNAFCLSDVAFSGLESARVVIYNGNDSAALVRIQAWAGTRRVKLNVGAEGSQVFLGAFQTLVVQLMPRRINAEHACIRINASVPLHAGVLGHDVNGSDFDRVWSTFAVVARAYEDVPRTKPVALTVTRASEANARAVDRNTVEVNAGLARRLSVPDELAFAVAHELGHIFQHRSNVFRYYDQQELDADAWALRLMVRAGYDPRAAGPALNKLRAGIEAATQLPAYWRGVFEERSRVIQREMPRAMAEHQSGASAPNFWTALAARVTILEEPALMSAARFSRLFRHTPGVSDVGCGCVTQPAIASAGSP